MIGQRITGWIILFALAITVFSVNNEAGEAQNIRPNLKAAQLQPGPSRAVKH